MDEIKGENVVDAIEDGRIVRVSEKYAVREGLPIIRRKEISFLGSPEKKQSFEEQRREMKGVSRFDTFRRPLHVKPNDILASLADNFYWEISQLRRARNLTRKQLAESLGVKELDIKMIENGVLPSNDYVLINKIEQFYGINLRKEGASFSAPNLAKEKENSKENTPKGESISGNDIEIELDED